MTVTSDATHDSAWLTSLIRDIADYPKPGVTFRDITPLLGQRRGIRQGGRRARRPVPRRRGRPGRRRRGPRVHPGAAVAYRLGAGFVPVRKAGKLPWAVAREEYELEYGTDKLEIHRDAIHPDEKILVIDDVLATGGTAAATARLIETLGGQIVGLGFLIEITVLGGRQRLTDYRVESLARY